MLRPQEVVMCTSAQRGRWISQGDFAGCVMALLAGMYETIDKYPLPPRRFG